MFNTTGKVVQTSITFGCDPEFFAETEDGKIAPSEEVLDKEKQGTVIRDGVQIELNPAPQSCRALLANSISTSIRELSSLLRKKGALLSTKAVIEVPKKQLAALSEASRALGCAASFNNNKNTIAITEEQKNTNLRSAGGHIHIGATRLQTRCNVSEFVTLLDLFVGNTAVLLDRDPLQAERRKLYGRAGEYRLPTHGLEYRTPSNFWMLSYPLMGLMMGLTRQAWWLAERENPTELENNIKYYTKELERAQKSPLPERANYWERKLKEEEAKTNHSSITTDIVAGIDAESVQRAINENDFDLALKNHEKTEELITKYFENYTLSELSRANTCPALTANGFEAFRFFVSKGIKHWFKGNMFQNWGEITAISDNHGDGWEGFMYDTVYPQMQDHKDKEKRKAEKLAKSEVVAATCTKRGALVARALELDKLATKKA